MVFVSVYSVEGWDRETLRLDKAGEELIKTVERGCAGKVVVVMHTAGPVIMEDWASRSRRLLHSMLSLEKIALPKISGVLWAGYPGESNHCRAKLTESVQVKKRAMPLSTYCGAMSTLLQK